MSHTCPECKSFRIKKNGIRKNKRGEFQRYRCKNCGKQFLDDDFLHMQTPRNVVAFAIRHWKHGYRPSWIVEEIKIVYKIKRSVYALFYWVKKFINFFEALNSLPLLGISKRLHFDYTYIKIAGEDAYFWAAKCSVTKAIAGWIITTTRNLEDAKFALREIKRRFPVTYNIDKLEIITDGENSFPRAIKEVFDHSAKHYSCKGFKDKKNNNMIETLWRFKDYIPEFRTIEQANRYFTIWTAFYNIRKLKDLSKNYEAYKISQIMEIPIFQRIFSLQVLWSSKVPVPFKILMINNKCG